MSFLFTKTHLSLRTTFPASTSRDDILRILHDHEALLRRSSVITWVEHIKPGEQGAPAAGDSYRGIEWVHYVMRNSFIATFTDVEDGTNNESLCDFGIRLDIKYRVTKGDESQGPVLTETVDIHAPYLVIMYTKFAYESVHREIQEKMVRELGSR